MAPPVKTTTPVGSNSQSDVPPVRPYISPNESPAEFTWSAVILGSLLGIIFGASSLYLVLRVGLTVSASIPVAVMSITIFRLFARMFKLRPATILENNVVQTAGSAGESIAFGIGVTMPALMMLGFDMEIVQVMTVGVLGGLLGILMMIPLRRAFVVKQHGTLVYPEGTACAEVLIVGEKGGSSAKTVFTGFGIAFLYNICLRVVELWSDTLSQKLWWNRTVGAGADQIVKTEGVKGAVLGAEITPELLGVGYIIGPKIAGITFGGGILAWLVLTPLIYRFSEYSESVIAPATVSFKSIDDTAIRNYQMRVNEQSMDPKTSTYLYEEEKDSKSLKLIKDSYITYIGAGAVATGGIISMLRAMPMILGALFSSFRDLRRKKGENDPKETVVRTERELPMWFVIAGCLGMAAALMAVPSLGLGFNERGVVGASLILLFGFLFVTVSARLTGTIGSSSNPISGMTISALLLTCLIFLLWGHTDKTATLTAMIIAAVVCIASSNGGTTAQDLKTGQLVGATPRNQQFAILIGTLTSALVMGFTLIYLNQAGTIYTNKAEYLPPQGTIVPDEIFSKLDKTKKEKVGGTHAAKDTAEYYVLHVLENEVPGVARGRYLIDENRQFRYLCDPPVNPRVGKTKKDPNDQFAPEKRYDDDWNAKELFDSPKTLLMGTIIDGVMKQKLPWAFVMLGALIAAVLELAGVPALPFAVGIYLPIAVSTPIFIGGLLRWLTDRIGKKKSASEDSSPGVLLSSGYIAGGAIAGMLAAFLQFSDTVPAMLSFEHYKSNQFAEKLITQDALDHWHSVKPLIGLCTFSALVLLLFLVGSGWLLREKSVIPEKSGASPPEKKRN